MPTGSVSAGDIAFVGPRTYPPSSYILVTKVHGKTATVKEAELWPGSYVGHPIAFAQSGDETSNLWGYGLVSGYSMEDNGPVLHVRLDKQTQRIPLTDTQSVIAVDRLNYALRTGATINSMTLNALELLDKQNEIIVACGKSRTGLSALVSSTMLSVPFVPDETTPLIRPDTLEIVSVRRQHIVDCELDRRGNNAMAVFSDPQLAQLSATATSSMLPNTNRNVLHGNTLDLAFSDSEDEMKTDVPSTVQADIDLVRLQNHPLRNRTREPETERDLLLSEGDVPTFPAVKEAQSASFRPSAMERFVHDAVVHPSLIGKNARGVLESVQQGSRTQFLATPPVLRLSYDFSFGVRGLSVLHFRRFHHEIDQQPMSSSVNMTNFNRSNALQPATPPKTISDIVGALQTLLLFAEGFYNSTVCNFIKAGLTFMEQFAVSSRPDASISNSLVSWIDYKLGKFRGEIIATNLQTAALIANEFTRNDDRLMERVQAHHQRQLTTLVTSKTTRAPNAPRANISRDKRAPKPSTVPRDLVALLPKQGNKTLCMKYLSKKGCNGPAPGQCFGHNRAQFKPLALPADAKTFIDKTFSV
ncbi:hypothetical protein F441_06302 [Phytophthora nicotianae CJ01A1]|uniref:Uncharacterized protein n=1 Tax=Phytophthora nicotianae CJ01A1 TaxID=1317063 RepID=W2XD28_PHYNI|nr:hypothetical protein F441_06302 [Phytophthora nicotianae CJ01A1]